MDKLYIRTVELTAYSVRHTEWEMHGIVDYATNKHCDEYGKMKILLTKSKVKKILKTIRNTCDYEDMDRISEYLRKNSKPIYIIWEEINE